VNRLHRGSSRGGKTNVTLLALAAVVALSLAGCSGGEEAKPKASGTTSPSGSAVAPAGALRDESAAVLNWAPPAPVAKIVGTLEPSTKKVPIPATAEIIPVNSSDISTILTWQLSSPEDIPIQGQTLAGPGSNGFFPNKVRLVDSVAKKSRMPSTRCWSLTFTTAPVPDIRSMWVLTRCG